MKTVSCLSIILVMAVIGKVFLWPLLLVMADIVAWTWPLFVLLLVLSMVFGYLDHIKKEDDEL